MMDVASQQSAERLRVLPRAAAAALMRQEANAVYIGKDALGARCRKLGGSVAVARRGLLHQLAHMAAIAILRDAVAQFLFERLAHTLHVAVFAKHQRQHQPVVARAYLAVGAMKAVEGARGPGRSIG